MVHCRHTLQITEADYVSASSPSLFTSTVKNTNSNDSIGNQRCRSLWEYSPFTNHCFILFILYLWCHYVEGSWPDIAVFYRGSSLVQLVIDWKWLSRYICLQKKVQESIKERGSLYSENNSKDQELWLVICLQRDSTDVRKEPRLISLEGIHINSSVLLAFSIICKLSSTEQFVIRSFNYSENKTIISIMIKHCRYNTYW